MEFPDELLNPDMIKCLAGKEPVLIAIIARDEEGNICPHAEVADVSDHERVHLAAAVQQLAYVVGYPDLDVDQFFSLSLVSIVNPPEGLPPVMGMTAGAPFGPPIGFMHSFASILAGVGSKLGINTAVTDTTGSNIQPATFAHPDGHVHGAPRTPEEPPTGQYL